MWRRTIGPTGECWISKLLRCKVRRFNNENDIRLCKKCLPWISMGDILISLGWLHFPFKLSWYRKSISNLNNCLCNGYSFLSDANWRILTTWNSGHDNRRRMRTIHCEPRIHITDLPDVQVSDSHVGRVVSYVRSFCRRILTSGVRGKGGEGPTGLGFTWGRGCMVTRRRLKRGRHILINEFIYIFLTFVWTGRGIL